MWKDLNGIERGLIVDLVDLSSGHIWSNINSIWSPGTINYFDGANNSSLIIMEPGHVTSAAALCMNSTNGGFNDWYLPSGAEWMLLQMSALVVNNALSNTPQANPMIHQQTYWTSSVDYFLYANNTLQFAILGATYTINANSSNNKNVQHRVRAIRTF